MALLYERCRKTTFSCKTMYNKKSSVQFLNVLNVIFMLTLRNNISKSCIQFCSLTLNFDLIFKALESAQKIWILTNFSKYLLSFSPLRNMILLHMRAHEKMKPFGHYVLTSQYNNILRLIKLTCKQFQSCLSYSILVLVNNSECTLTLNNLPRNQIRSSDPINVISVLKSRKAFSRSGEVQNR